MTDQEARKPSEIALDSAIRCERRIMHALPDEAVTLIRLRDERMAQAIEFEAQGR